jgi:hypothetical protein
VDCTRTARQRSLYRGLVAAVAAGLACLSLVATARADGDPASDVLAVQTVFLPQDAGLSHQQQLELASLVKAAQSAGFRLRVALIASLSDLGSVTELWRAPRLYAHFLAQELSFVYHGGLLVVMPNGYGVYGVGGARVDASALGPLDPPGRALGPAALAAVRRLAAAAGHQLPLPPAVGAGSGGSADPIPWVIFALGLALIAGAWTLSIRARPLGADTSHGPSA